MHEVELDDEDDAVMGGVKLDVGLSSQSTVAVAPVSVSVCNFRQVLAWMTAADDAWARRSAQKMLTMVAFSMLLF